MTKAKKMKWLDYMEQSPEENLGWCKPYTNDTRTHVLIMTDGLPGSIMTPTVTAHSYGYEANDDFAAQLNKLAREVNPDYDLYRGDDVHIALEAMHEIGCAECPFRAECDAMDAPMYEDM